MTNNEKRYMQTWRIGAVTITKIVEFEAAAPDFTRMIPLATREALLRLSWLKPHFLTDDGQVKASVHALVIQTPAHLIIVDACTGNDKERPARPIFHRLQTPFLADMKAAGFSPESFDTVLCTHLHVDHVGWNTMLVDGRWVPTFPSARYLFNKVEYDYWEKGEGVTTAQQWDEIQRATFADSVKPVFDAGLSEFVGFTHRICEEVDLVPTVGHTPGHVSVRISSQGEQALITGDMAHHPCQLAHPEWSTYVDFDAEQGIKTRREVWARYADTPTLIIGTHWAGATAGHIVRDGDAYRLKV
jgi:glyoxylase-like metal-dependent hydrolase (beta-lactamase superfamily II)